MKRKRTALRSERLAKPPREFRIFAAGTIRTTKGEYLFDEEAAASVIAAWRDYGNRLVIDYEHKSVDENARAGDGKAAGWFDIQLRGDELWAVNVRWTPKAAKEISEFEWAYFSPTFDYDEDSGRILELVNVAITNIPATKDLNQLVAAHRKNVMKNKKKTALTSKKQASAKAASQNLSAKAKKASVKTAEKPVAADEDLDDPPELDELDEELDEEETDDVPPKAEEEDDETDDVPPKKGEEEDEEDLDEEEEGMDEELEELANPSDGYPDTVKEKPAPVKTKRQTTDEIVTAARSELAKQRATNAKQTQQLTALAKDVAQMKRERLKRGVREMLSKAQREGRITPAEAPVLERIGMRSPKELREMLSLRQKHVSTATEMLATPLKDAHGQPVMMSRDEMSIAQRLSSGAGRPISLVDTKKPLPEMYAEAKQKGLLIDFTGAGNKH